MLGIREYFGDDDIIKKCKRSYTAKCYSYEGVIVVLSSEAFL